jgi:shikimate dehydrogenase
MIRAGVMGWPVEHSRSPALHGFWLKHYGIAGEYVTLPVPPDGLRTALRALPQEGFAGCNLTLPHKEAALAVIDHVDLSARRIGAVNTIVVRSDQSLEGRNTDAFGFIENLHAGAPDWRADRGAAVVLGAGGAARAVVAALLDADWEKRERALGGATLLVNTTSLGMHGAPPLELALDALDRAAVVNDIVYVPLETPLLAAARRRGNPVVNGLGMLLHQARPAFAAWFGKMPEVTPALRRAVEATL